ncbi:putative transport protein [Alkalithermobacter thermoalcaliphilus JW-YL-7 = DSM 7308]|uniref:Transport protein n=1 Tax=Alkalithermobacter thermoalcaliphilus JW-YL-7 = DSM 7308 TaxID=1121328 RepID=A0A150FS64_CLOPD|nr:YidE/YbjL duplication [[Clostridium] paradoxum JW-YL-7 = DSM 7308]SHK32785.1 putative transport protein [[Clostridium] paradoxum JW-YL-7 = DSM 7308]
MNFGALLSNPLLLMCVSIFVGQLVGKISYKNVKLGSSGGLFVGIFISYFVTIYLQNNYPSLVKSSFISSDVFSLSLIGFIASVGLLASKNIRRVIKENGYRFIFLAFTITFSGALSTLIFSKFLTNLKSSIIGTYVGALTSSPGLATAMESAKLLGEEAQAMVGLGYSISYIPGVVSVILFVQLLGKYSKEKNHIKEADLNRNNEKIKESNFCIISFAMVCLLGIVLGEINIYLGSYLGYFSLGSTGGVLMSALILGDIKKIGFLNFDMNKGQLAVVRDISLNMFLSIVGLNYGYNALTLIKTSGVQLLIMGMATALVSILVGYLVGKYILKLNTVNLVGGICGGMTSTPGLASSIEALESDEVTVAYGATYPFALFFMILFTNILFKI